MFRVQEIILMISLTLTTAVVDILDYEGLEIEERPLPPELSFIMVNKTIEEQRLEECMKDYSDCISAHRNVYFCAKNENNEMRTFYTLCEMSYENCKLQRQSWQYIGDDPCQQVPYHP